MGLRGNWGWPSGSTSSDTSAQTTCPVGTMPANREINGDTEGFGMGFIEAAACGESAIAGEAGGTGAAVVDGITGYRVDGSHAAPVAVALYRVLADPDSAPHWVRLLHLSASVAILTGIGWQTSPGACVNFFTRERT